MNLRILPALLLIPWAVFAAEDPYTDLNKQVQENLRERGFYSGPVNGVVGPNTQAAIAQFQLSIPMPASGMLDDTTLAALGVEPPAPASAGQTAAGQSAETTTAESAAPDRKLGGTCDELVGPEKENCLKRGGTVEASVPASSGATGSSNK